MSAAIVADLREIILQRFKTAPLRELLDLHDAQPMKPIPLIAPRFEIIDDDLVIDHNTGLTWLRGFVPGGRRSYDESIKAAAAFSLRGMKFGAPTIEQRLSINDYERHNPAIDTNVFRSEASGWEWTATVDHVSPADRAWFVNFGNGFSDRGSRNGSGFVRGVRVGQF